MHSAAALRTLHGKLVNVWAVKLYCLGALVTSFLIEILTASNRFHMTAAALPDIQWSSPVTVTADSPVLNVLKPVAETSFTDALRDPVNGVVIADQVIFNSCHFNKPGFSCVVDQWCIATPAVWVIMLKFRSIEQLAFFFKISQYHWVCFLNKYTGIWCLSSKITLAIYKLYKRKVIFTSYTAVVFTKCRSDMNDTGTITHGNVVITYEIMRFLALGCYIVTCAFKQRLIFLVFQVFSFIGFQNLICRLFFLCKLAKYFVKKCFCHIVSVSVCCFYFTVSLIRIYAKCNVRRQCPRCCGPCQEICVLSNHFETCDRRTLFY